MKESSGSIETRDLVRLVLWFGIVTGAIEVACLGIIKIGTLASVPAGWASPDERIRHSYLWLSLHVVWMAPTALSIFLAIPAAVLAVAGRFSRSLGSVRWIVGVLTFLCSLSLLNIYPRLYFIAVLALAAGIGLQVGRFAETKQVQFLGVVRRTTRWLASAVALVALTMNVGGVLREGRRLGALDASPNDAPNVLLLILDTVRAANMSLYGYDKGTTPNLDRLAEKGVTFDRAIATSPWTLPSHLSMFTGRLPYEHAVNFLIPDRGDHTMLAEFLVQRGYVTAGFVGNLVYCTEESGITSGFIHYEDHQLVATEFVKSTALGRRLERAGLMHELFEHYDAFGDKDAEEVTGEFLEWVEGRPTDRPFFAFLNYIDAHEPYLPPPRFESAFGSATDRQHDLNTYFIRWAARADRMRMGGEEVAAELAAYDGTIAYVDEQIGILLDDLRAKGILDNTVVIVASDHGEQFGEHGLHVHGNSLYLPNLHVPLMVSYGDNLPAGFRVGTPVSIRDIPATVVSLTGLDAGAPFPGSSLERFWTGTGTDSSRPVEPVFSELTDIRGAPTTKSLLVGRYHYIWGENRVEVLFDIESDPGEETSLMRRENLELVTRMRQLMAPHIRNDAALWERLPQND